MRAELEACLLCAPPSELIVPEGTSAPTRRLATCLAPGLRVNTASAALFQKESDAREAVQASFDCAKSAPELPGLVVRSLAYAHNWLRVFGLDRVLQLVDGFTELQPARSMALSPNTLRYSVCVGACYRDWHEVGLAFRPMLPACCKARDIDQAAPGHSLRANN